MKTPMQELLQDIKDGGDAIYMIERFYIEKEKQQIIDAFNQGFREGETETTVADTQKDVSEYDDGINYYNETYK